MIARLPLSVGSNVTWELLIGTVCLELSPVPLHEQIKEFGAGCSWIQPPSGSATISAAGSACDGRYSNWSGDRPTSFGSRIEDCSATSLRHSPWSESIGNSDGYLKADARLLLAHGSRRSGSKDQWQQQGASCADLCGRQNWRGSAFTAKVGITVKELVNAGHQQIESRHFLFAGELQMRSLSRLRS